MVNSSLHWPHAYYFLRRRSSTAILVRQSQITRSKLKLPFAWGSHLGRCWRTYSCIMRSTCGWREGVLTSRSSATRMTPFVIVAVKKRPGRCGHRLEKRFAQCGLTLHPDKTKVVYCKDDDRRGDVPRPQVRFPRLYVSAAAVLAPVEGVRRLVQSGGQRQSSQDDPANCPTLGAPSTQRQDAG